MKNSGRSRHLTTGEIKLAKSMFGTSIDYKKVRIAHKRATPMQPKNGGLCTLNTINMDGDGYCVDYSKETPGMQAFFIHEMTHIWQYQSNALSLATKFISESLRFGRKYFEKAYKYDLNASEKFSKYGVEQQACMMEDWFFLKNFPENDKYFGRCINTDMSQKQRLKHYAKITAGVFSKPQPPRPSAHKIT